MMLTYRMLKEQIAQMNPVQQDEPVLLGFPEGFSRAKYFGKLKDVVNQEGSEDIDPEEFVIDCK